MTDTDIKALVERLRESELRNLPEQSILELFRDAADALEACQAENERLAAFYDEGTMALASLRKDLLHANARAANAEAALGVSTLGKLDSAS